MAVAFIALLICFLIRKIYTKYLMTSIIFGKIPDFPKLLFIATLDMFQTQPFKHDAMLRLQ